MKEVMDKTPVPWKSDGSSITDSNGKFITLFIPGIGEAIVQAVNSYERSKSLAKDLYRDNYAGTSEKDFEKDFKRLWNQHVNPRD